jgi:glycosyltransferase involved in cell wall biosynthesis
MKVKRGIIIGIDASRNRSGGAKAHLIGILSAFDTSSIGIYQIHVWSFKSLLESLPERPWLVKHNPDQLEKSLFNQLAWQANSLAVELINAKCDILFTSDASSFCRFKPMVILSQDMLSYEPGVMRYFRFGFARLRLIAILYLQNAAFRNAQGVIFLTRYAAKLIQKSCGPLSSIAYIPHGVDSQFNLIINKDKLRNNFNGNINCIYVSNAEMYKHQWVVVEAIAMLKKAGYNLTLTLVGGGKGPAQKLIDNTINKFDPKETFIKKLSFLPHNKLPDILAKSDLSIFASSCENMPVTLLESMAAGLPIACSNRGPMPEILEDGGVYFDPFNVESIAYSIEKIILDSDLRLKIAVRAKELANLYSWERCSKETFSFVVQTYKKFLKKNNL